MHEKSCIRFSLCFSATAAAYHMRFVHDELSGRIVAMNTPAQQINAALGHAAEVVFHTAKVRGEGHHALNVVKADQRQITRYGKPAAVQHRNYIPRFVITEAEQSIHAFVLPAQQLGENFVLLRTKGGFGRRIRFSAGAQEACAALAGTDYRKG